MKHNFFIYLLSMSLVYMAPLSLLQAQKQASVYTTGTFLDFPCQTMDSLENYTVNPVNMEFSKYGGWKAHQVEATGFFRVEEIDGRWWAVDPEGYLYIHKAVNTVDLDHTTADEAYQMFAQYGFNGFGCWSDEDILKSSLKDETPMSYCPKLSFIAEYRRDREVRIEMPVFDDAFEAYANNLAKGFEPYKNDPSVFGYMSDNELNWRDEGLPAHLEITDPTDKNYITAIDFLTARGKTADDYDTEDHYAYIALMGERYYSIVSAAIKAVDPNHMYIGTRCHSTERFVEDFMRNAGKYVDIFSTNHYNRWGARQVEIGNMSEWANRPLMITEYYAMEMVDGNGEGAGWSVEDQPSRSWFNDNYVSTLAQTGKLVGFHWFRYQDKPLANKGVISETGVPYTALLNDMKLVNDQLYNFIDYYDSKATPAVRYYPEADAYFKGSTNYGTDIDLKIKAASSETSSSHREIYIRFNVSDLTTEVVSAKVRLYGISEGSENGIYSAHLVSDNSWGETTITANNNPARSTLLKSWGQADDLVIDVTEVLNDAIRGDKKLSLCLFSSYKDGGVPEYASREYPDERARPMLDVYTDTVTTISEHNDASSSSTSKVYPNPTTDELNILGSDNVQVRIFNSLGQLIYNTYHSNGGIRMSVANWNNGFYLLELNDGTNVSTQTFIKK